MKIDCTKLSNKGDLLALIGVVVILVLVSVVIYLAANSHTFLAGFISATITLKWKTWLFDPVDQLLEKNWPFKS